MPTPPLPRIALAGASGRVGLPILRALLSSQFLPSYASITVLQLPTSRPPPITPLPPIVSLRAISPTNPLPSLHDIDVLISAVGSSGHDYKDALARALPSTGIRLYIPSEFGVDHTCHDFSHEEWDHKKAHYALLCAPSPTALRPDQRVQRIYVGLFLEESIGPWFGMDASKGRYESVGSADAKVSYTSLEDAGRVVAQLARMQMGAAIEEVRVAGDTVSMREVAEIMKEAQAEAAGDAGGEGLEYEITELPLHEFKAATIEQGTKDPSKCLRFLMGEGKIEHSKDSGALGNDNQVINPNETLWKWKTMRDYGRETGGRAWDGVEWDAGTAE